MLLAQARVGGLNVSCTIGERGVLKQKANVEYCSKHAPDTRFYMTRRQVTLFLVIYSIAAPVGRCDPTT